MCRTTRRTAGPDPNGRLKNQSDLDLNYTAGQQTPSSDDGNPFRKRLHAALDRVARLDVSVDDLVTAVDRELDELVDRAVVGRAASSMAAELTQGLDARGLDYEVIFAENGSRDATPEIFEGMCAKNARLRWFHSDRPNYGKWARLRELFARLKDAYALSTMQEAARALGPST